MTARYLLPLGLFIVLSAPCYAQTDSQEMEIDVGPVTNRPGLGPGTAPAIYHRHLSIEAGLDVTYGRVTEEAEGTLFSESLAYPMPYLMARYGILPRLEVQVLTGFVQERSLLGGGESVAGVIPTAVGVTWSTRQDASNVFAFTTNFFPNSFASAELQSGFNSLLFIATYNFNVDAAGKHVLSLNADYQRDFATQSDLSNDGTFGWSANYSLGLDKGWALFGELWGFVYGSEKGTAGAQQGPIANFLLATGGFIYQPSPVIQFEGVYARSIIYTDDTPSTSGRRTGVTHIVQGGVSYLF